MKNLLAVLAVGEAAIGIVVLAAPGVLIDLLLGVEPVASTLIMTRFAGVVLVSFGIACYPWRPRQGLRGLLAYNILVTLFLIPVGIKGAGVLLWPVVALDAALAGVLLFAARAPAGSRR